MSAGVDISVPLVVGHRGFGSSTYGCTSLHPENSIAAVEEAIHHCVDAVEIDVWMSSDGVVVVLHDEHIDRTVVYDGELTVGDIACMGQCNRCKGNGISIECLNWDSYHSRCPEGLQLRNPWQLLKLQPPTPSCGNNSSNEPNNSQPPACIVDSSVCISSNTVDYENSYRLCSRVHKGKDGSSSRVPTLEEVMVRLHGKIKCNVELKGTNPKLGPKVLEICSAYSSSVLSISSFCWIPQPPLACSKVKCSCHSDINKDPNGLKKVDLLAPIVNNTWGIPIALLFNDGGKHLPSPERIVECLDQYNSQWAHIHYKGEVICRSPCALQQSRKTPELNELSIRVEESVGADEGVQQPGEDTKERQIEEVVCDLPDLVKCLSLHGKQVMTYWPGSGEDKEEDLCTVIKAGVAAICPNNPALAIDIINKHKTSRHE